MSRRASRCQSRGRILPQAQSAVLGALAGAGRRTHHRAMFVVSDEDAAAIRAAFEQEGEFAAAIELRRRFPLIQDNAQACAQARTIAGWQPLPAMPEKRLRRRPLS